MGNKYLELQKKHREEFEAFPMVFAFNDKQFKEAMGKLGLDPVADIDKVYSVSSGGIYKKSDAQALHDMLERQCKETQEAIQADEDGNGYIFDMFSYELANHEYSYTGDLAPTLYALGLTIEEVRADEKLLSSMNRARRQCMEAHRREL